jgi:hypothetical protein
VCLAGIVTLADVAIYRGQGFAGYSLLFALAPLLLCGGVARRNVDRSLWVVAPLTAVLAARLIWCGDWLGVSVGFALLAAGAMALVGQRPYVLECVVFVSQTIPAGVLALLQYSRVLSWTRRTEGRTNWPAVLIPAGALCLFSLLFLLANPDLLTWFSTELSQMIRRVRDWLVEFAPEPLEVLFWVGVAWIAAGLLRPLMPWGTAGSPAAPEGDASGTTRLAPARLYEAYRNTLAGVVVLFAVYLAFEFQTLWFREFPRGFHYSGYAHEGAAWLTVALALATLMLSAIFQGRMLHDPRLAVLRRWAGVWAIENLVLALAVYHRLFIYIGFNGMTRMRTVGLLGITAVVVGFVLVLVKIRRNHSFLWLIRGHMWTLAGAIYLYAVLPVDTLAMSYNVRRILGGDPAPSVQISVHPISAEGLLVLRPLLESEDAIIREGVRAMLAERLQRFEMESKSYVARHWTAFQIADGWLESQLDGIRSELAPHLDPSSRRAARAAFDGYAYQWY